MQISSGTCTVTNDEAVVVGSSDVDWIDAQTAIQYGSPVLFSLQGAAEVPRKVVAVEPPSTSASGNWELTLESNWTGPTQADVPYIIHKDFTLNLSLPLASGGERQWAQLFSDMAVKLDAAYAGAGGALVAGVTTPVAPGKTMHATGILDVPLGAVLDIQVGGAVDVG